MGEIKKNYKIKLICGILFNPLWCSEKFDCEKENLNFITQQINSIVEKELLQNFGIPVRADLHSEIIKFDTTNYYNDEMGEEILRYWISFSPSVKAEDVYKVKILTNKIEEKYFSDKEKNRKVNLDPGYIEGSKLVLFSTKNYSHRVYINEGIFAEITLLYKNKQFQILSWTYPDYKLQVALDFFAKVREKALKECLEDN